MTHVDRQKILLITILALTSAIAACATYKADFFDLEKDQYHSYKNNFTVQIPAGYKRIVQSYIPRHLKRFVDLVAFSDTGIPRTSTVTLAFYIAEDSSQFKSKFYAESRQEALNIFTASPLWERLQKTQISAVKRSGMAAKTMNIYNYHDFRIIEIPLEKTNQSILAATVYPIDPQSNEYRSFVTMFVIPNRTAEKHKATFRQFLDDIEFTAFGEEVRKP